MGQGQRLRRSGGNRDGWLGMRDSFRLGGSG